MRNFQNAAQKYGGSILGEYKGWCAGHYDATSSVGSIPFGNGCTYWGTTLKFSKDGKEIMSMYNLEMMMLAIIL